MVASHPPHTGTWSATQACDLIWELNLRPFGSQVSVQSTEPHQTGSLHYIKIRIVTDSEYNKTRIGTLREWEIWFTEILKKLRELTINAFCVPLVACYLSGFVESHDGELYVPCTVRHLLQQFTVSRARSYSPHKLLS